MCRDGHEAFETRYVEILSARFFLLAFLQPLRSDFCLASHLKSTGSIVGAFLAVWVRLASDESSQTTYFTVLAYISAYPMLCV